MLNGLFIENWNMLRWLRLQDANVGNIDIADITTWNKMWNHYGNNA
jgi:hypothetical protein